MTKAPLSSIHLACFVGLKLPWELKVDGKEISVVVQPIKRRRGNRTGGCPIFFGGGSVTGYHHQPTNSLYSSRKKSVNKVPSVKKKAVPLFPGIKRFSLFIFPPFLLPPFAFGLSACVCGLKRSILPLSTRSK